MPFRIWITLFLLLLVPKGTCGFSSRPRQQQGRANLAEQQSFTTSALPPDAALPLVAHNIYSTTSRSPSPPSILKPVMIVASLNVLINSLRPDPFISPEMRLPRILWELCIGLVAVSAREEPLFLLVLSLMTLSTALMDIFVWGPVFAFSTSWQTCEGGGWFSRQPRVCVTDYVKGSSRLVASIQSTLGGFFYLVTAVICWQTFWEQQEHRRMQRHTAILQHVMNHQSISQEQS